MAQHAFTRSRTDWEKVWKRGMISFLILILLLVLFLFFAFRINQFSVFIQLEGDEAIYLELGESFQDPGAHLMLQGTHLLKDGFRLKDSKILIQGHVEDTVVGEYTLTYSGGVFGLPAQHQRKVTVVDSVSPVITLFEDVTKRWHIGYSAQDNYDGDITDQVICQEYLGRMSFAVLDSSGNPGYIEKAIPFHDVTAPVITLTGGETYEISVGDSYSEPGYEAIDNADGLMTSSVLVEGEVNCFVPGIYPITYTAIDSADNEANVVRRVEVKAKPRPEVVMPKSKTVYLTFDDGPGPYTKKLLEVLDQYGVKATFFVKNGDQNEQMKEIVDRGHSIGIHSVTHDYAAIYADPEAYFQDLRQMQQIIREQTGVETTLMRFPGGSSNTVSRNTYPGLMTLLTEAVQDAGFQFFDWNVDSNDAGGTTRTKGVVENVVQGIAKEPVSLVLQHDIHSYSVDAVEQIILWCLVRGYRFLSLDTTSPGFHHPLHN